MNLKPTKGNVLIKLMKEKDMMTTEGGIRVPRNVAAAEAKRNEAMVMEIGDEITVVKKGDRVVFNAYNGIPLSITNSISQEMEGYFVVPENGILAIFQDD